MAEKSRHLLDFLIALAEDPLRAKRFKSNPEAELAGAGLTDEEKDVLRSRDPGRIRAALAAEPPEQPWMMLLWLAGMPEAGEGTQ
jgi:hypothetical protein